MARPRGNRKTSRLSVSLDDQAYAVLCEIARQQDVSVAWIVRRAVNELIERQTEEDTQPELPLTRKASASHRGSL